MEALTLSHYCGIAIVLALMIFTGIYSGRMVKSSTDFISGNRNWGTALIAGALVSTLVGSSATMGVAQSAFTEGISAWLFTFGLAVGCLVFSVGLYKPIRKSSSATLDGLIKDEFGNKAGAILATLTALSFFPPLISQFVAASSLLGTMFGLTGETGTFIIALLTLVVVFFGGVCGSGFVGVIKTILLCLSILLCGVFVLTSENTVSTMLRDLPHEQYFNIFPNGAGLGFSEVISAMLGAIVSQSCVQAIMAGRTEKCAQAGSFVSALVTLFIGLGSVLVGLAMRLNSPESSPLKAFPNFVLSNLPPLLSGVVLGVLLITIVATGATIALSTSSVLVNSLYKTFSGKAADDKRILLASRLVIVASLLITMLITFVNLESVLLRWTYLSFELRAAALMIPMGCALFFKGRADSRIVIWASLLGVLIIFLGNSKIQLPISPLYFAIIIEVLIIVVGSILIHRHRNCPNRQYPPSL